MGEVPIGADIGALLLASEDAAMAEYDLVGEEEGSLRREADETAEELVEVDKVVGEDDSSLKRSAGLKMLDWFKESSKEIAL